MDRSVDKNEETEIDSWLAGYKKLDTKNSL